MMPSHRTAGRVLRFCRMALVRFMALHAAIGFGIAAIFVAALLLADPGGIGTLLRHPSAGPVALLWFFSGLTFAGVQIGAAVMLRDD